MAEEDLFFRALELLSADRSEFLRRECVDDADLRKKVEALLELDQSGSSIVDKPCGMLRTLSRFSAGDEIDERRLF